MKTAARKSMVMSKSEINLFVDEPKWEKALENLDETACKVFETALNYLLDHEEFYFATPEKTLSFNLSFSNDAEVQLLNKEFRNMDKPTNVLSFANIDDDFFEEDAKENDVIEMGDIIIAFETMQKEAEVKQISLHDHFCHLFTHGILHLMGLDHQDDEEAEQMEDYETKILQILNIDNPYKE